MQREMISVREASELGALIGKPGEPLAEALRRTLLEMIIFGYFEPGFRLYPEKLAEQFDVSLTPVREALMRLAAEGFIDVIHRRGFHVRNPDARQVKNIWQVRLAMELMAGELVIDRLANGELAVEAIDPLEEIQDKLDIDPQAISRREKHELNGGLHHGIVALCGNDLLITTFRGIQMQVLNAWIHRGLESWRSRHSAEAEEHRLILGALRNRDKPAYERACRRHLARSLKDALADLEAKGISR